VLLGLLVKKDIERKRKKESKDITTKGDAFINKINKFVH